MPKITVNSVQFLRRKRRPRDRQSTHGRAASHGESDRHQRRQRRPVDVELGLDASTTHTNVTYDSHTAAQDLVTTFAAGQQTFQWNYTVPATGPDGQYYSDIKFHDPTYAAVFADTAWQTAFTVVPPEPTRQAPRPP